MADTPRGNAARFIKRLDSYSRAFARLEELVSLINQKVATSLFPFVSLEIETSIVQESLIKRFEFTQELSWNVLKDYLYYQGVSDLIGSRDVYRRALKENLISSDLWMNMIADRNLSAHDYNDAKAEAIALRIVQDYYPLLAQLKTTLEVIADRIPEEER